MTPPHPTPAPTRLSDEQKAKMRERCTRCAHPKFFAAVCCEDVIALLDELATVTAEREWTPLSKQKPADGAQVLVCWGNCCIAVAYRDGDEWRTVVQKANEKGFAPVELLSSSPTHWMPLPGSPREYWDGGMDQASWVTDHPVTSALAAAAGAGEKPEGAT